MSRDKKKPEITEETIGVNPFLDELEILVNRRDAKVINKFGREDIREVEYEATPYTKVFEQKGYKKQIFELPIRSKEFYLYLIHSLTGGQDYVWIDRPEYMSKMGITSINTYKSAVQGLIPEFVRKHDRFKDVFWINPKYFFKGSRLNKYPKHIITKKSEE